MEPFLQQVASHYYKEGITNTLFIFPNRRSASFFRKYLGAEVKGKPVLAPGLLTINDFFYKVYGVGTSHRVSLLVELYDVYKGLYPNAEPLDEFIFWGNTLLQDFDDVDKYLVNAKGLFANVSDFKAIQDSYSYLSEGQQTAIENFLKHFRDGSGRLTVKIDGGEGVKSRFLQIWNILFPLYSGFREVLRAKGLAYEGMVYRDLAERIKGETPLADILKSRFPETRKYVFVGLNALNECEKAVLGRMRDAGLAEFVWDWVTPMIKHPLNKSSFFMKDNLASFPQAFPVTAGTTPEVHVVSVPSAVGQAKLLPGILKQRTPGDLVETAVVLPDENMLMPVLNTIPPDVEDINVTMGNPLKGGGIYTLVMAIAGMQQHLRPYKGGLWFYHRDVRAVMSCSVFKRILTQEEEEIVKKVKEDAKYYIPEADLHGGPLLDLIFKPVVTDPKAADAEQIQKLQDYLRAIVSFLGWSLREHEEMLLELDYAKSMNMVLNVLSGIDLEVKPATWLRLLDQILDGESVPFEGEPLKGLQIMGPLETRALDFSNLVILSCNEGVFPRKSVSSSFIPPELRKGFGLPTYEYQDAVWAYYFYRLLQRASKVWLVYDSRTEGLRSGEESRYIKQLRYHFGVKLIMEAASGEMHPAESEKTIEKTEADVAVIKAKELSASALRNYLNCEAKFYYSTVKGLKAEDEVEESLTANMLGNVFHKTMQDLYSGRTTVDSAYLKKALADEDRIKEIIRAHILEEMHSIEVSGRNLVVEEVILDYVKEALKHDQKLLSNPKASPDGFTIIGLEKEMRYRDFHGFNFHGFVDRIDSYIPGEVRIVDYKTGKVEDKDLNITDDNAADVVEKLFGESNKGRPEIALQLFLYGLFASIDPKIKGNTLVNSIYSTTRLYSEPLEDKVQSQEFLRLTKQRLEQMLDQMVDINRPFHRTEEEDTCQWCDFKNICGR